MMHILHTINPTLNQKKVLAIIASNTEHPVIAIQQLSASPNLIAARNLLMKLNVITFTDDNVQLTDRGEQLAKDYNIIDDSGTLTDEGQQLVSDKSQQPSETPPMENPDMGMGLGTAPPTSPPGNPPLPGMEGFSPLFIKMIIG